MATWDLAAIRQLVRQVTGRYAEEELSTVELDTAINQYYQFTFPAEVKLDCVKGPFSSHKCRDQPFTKVDPLINATDRPQLDEWGPTIGYGTARNLMAKYGEMDAYRETTALYKEQVSYILARTEQNLLHARSLPNF